MRVDQVGGRAQDVRAQVRELVQAVGEGGDLGGADRREVEGIPEEDEPAARVVGAAGGSDRGAGGLTGESGRGSETGAGWPTWAGWVMGFVSLGSGDGQEDTEDAKGLFRELGAGPE